MEEKPVKGSCLCGQVTYEILPRPLFFQYCHCSRCRKRSGSAHGAGLFLKIENFKWTAGEELVRRFELPEAKYYCTEFCSICGSALPWLSRNGQYVLVPVGTLDGDPGCRPERNIYWGSRAPWFTATTELPVFDEGP